MPQLRYHAVGLEAQFEPGSRGRVLRNHLGIVRARDMAEAESQALEIAQEAALDRYGPDHRFSAKDVCDLHRLWLGICTIDEVIREDYRSVAEIRRFQ